MHGERRIFKHSIVDERRTRNIISQVGRRNGSCDIYRGFYPTRIFNILCFIREDGARSRSCSRAREDDPRSGGEPNGANAIASIKEISSFRTLTRGTEACNRSVMPRAPYRSASYDDTALRSLAFFRAAPCPSDDATRRDASIF